MYKYFTIYKSLGESQFLTSINFYSCHELSSIQLSSLPTNQWTGDDKRQYLPDVL